MKRLLKNTSLYFIAQIFDKAILFSLVPILTRILSPKDYGILSLVLMLVSIFTALISISIHASIKINFFEMKKNKLKIYIANAFFVLSFSIIFVFFFIYLFHPQLLVFLKIKSRWYYLAAIIAYNQIICLVLLTLYECEEKPIKFGIFKILQTIIATFLSLFFIIYFKWSWEGRVIGILLTNILFSVISIYLINKMGYLKINYHQKSVNNILSFGVPLIPHNVSGFLKNAADRFTISITIGLSSNGVYTAGYEICAVLIVAISAFQQAWSPYFLKKLSKNPSKNVKISIIKKTYIYFVVLIFFGFILTLLLNALVPIILGKAFISSIIYIPYIICSFIFLGMYTILSNYIFLVKKTHVLSFISFFTLGLHLVIMYYMSINYGVIGVAQANMISSFFMFCFVLIAVFKLYKMPWLLV